MSLWETSVSSMMKCPNITPQFFVPARYDLVRIVVLCGPNRTEAGAKKGK